MELVYVGEKELSNGCSSVWVRKADEVGIFDEFINDHYDGVKCLGLG